MADQVIDVLFENRQLEFSESDFFDESTRAQLRINTEQSDQLIDTDLIECEILDYLNVYMCRWNRCLKLFFNKNSFNEHQKVHIKDFFENCNKSSEIRSELLKKQLPSKSEINQIVQKVSQRSNLDLNENYCNYSLQINGRDFYIGKMNQSYQRNILHLESAYYLYEAKIKSTSPKIQIIHYGFDHGLNLSAPVFNKNQNERNSFVFETCLIQQFKNETSFSNIDSSSISVSSLNDSDKLKLNIFSNNNLTSAEKSTETFTHQSLNDTFGESFQLKKQFVTGMDEKSLLHYFSAFQQRKAQSSVDQPNLEYYFKLLKLSYEETKFIVINTSATKIIEEFRPIKLSNKFSIMNHSIKMFISPEERAKLTFSSDCQKVKKLYKIYQKKDELALKGQLIGHLSIIFGLVFRSRIHYRKVQTIVTDITGLKSNSEIYKDFFRKYFPNYRRIIYNIHTLSRRLNYQKDDLIKLANEIEPLYRYHMVNYKSQLRTSPKQFYILHQIKSLCDQYNQKISTTMLSKIFEQVNEEHELNSDTIWKYFYSNVNTNYEFNNFESSRAYEGLGENFKIRAAQEVFNVFYDNFNIDNEEFDSTQLEGRRHLTVQQYYIIYKLQNTLADNSIARRQYSVKNFLNMFNEINSEHVIIESQISYALQGKNKMLNNLTSNSFRELSSEIKTQIDNQVRTVFNNHYDTQTRSLIFNN